MVYSQHNLFRGSFRFSSDHWCSAYIVGFCQRCTTLNANYWPITLLSIRLIFAYYPHGFIDDASSSNLLYNGSGITCSVTHIPHILTCFVNLLKSLKKEQFIQAWETNNNGLRKDNINPKIDCISHSVKYNAWLLLIVIWYIAMYIGRFKT